MLEIATTIVGQLVPVARRFGSAGRRRRFSATPSPNQDADTPALSVVLLGTGTPLPDPDRAGPPPWCGQTRCGSWSTPNHICDLNDVITTHWAKSREPTSLAVVGPPEVGEVVEAALAMLRADIGTASPIMPI